jgi:hypothetical protein
MLVVQIIRLNPHGECRSGGGEVRESVS